MCFTGEVGAGDAGDRVTYHWKRLGGAVAAADGVGEGPLPIGLGQAGETITQRT